MTPAELRHAASILNAAAGGQKIEGRLIYAKNEKWEQLRINGVWRFDICEYRIAPEAVRVRLFERNDAYAGVFVAQEPQWINYLPPAWKPCSPIIEIEVRRDQE